jgi:leucyl aminopeptidase (aminopeptidase T)
MDFPDNQTHIIAPWSIENQSSVSEKMEQLTSTLTDLSTTETTKDRVKLLCWFWKTDSDDPISKEEFQEKMWEIREIEEYKNKLYANLFRDLEKQYIGFSGKILVQVPLSHAWDFIPQLIERKNNANSVFSKLDIEYVIIDPESIKQLAENEGEVKDLYEWYLEKVRNADKFVQIVDTAAWNQTFLDEDNKSAREEVTDSYKSFIKEINKMGAKSGWKKLRLYFPTKEMAEKEWMTEKEFYELYSNATSLDWQRIEEANEQLAELIREYDTVHVKGDGTDISFDISEMGARNSVIQTNWPGSEVHTAPQREWVNGVIAYNESVYIKMLDIKIPWITFKIKDWKMITFNIHWDHENKKDITEKLEEIFNKNEVNRYIGELAFGTNFFVPTGIVHPLIWEKALWMHIAFWNSYNYDWVDNGNNEWGWFDTWIHWDVIKNMKWSTVSFSKKDWSKIEIMTNEKFNPSVLPKLANYQAEIDSKMAA